MKSDRNDKWSKRCDELMRIFRSAVSEAQAENRRLGIPNVYVINGTRYFELPDGEITRTPPPGWPTTNNG